MYKPKMTISIRTRQILSGCYIIQYAKNQTIKCGRAKDIEKRLQQYRGYQWFGQPVKKLLIIKSKRFEMLEKLLHSIINQKYQRIGRFEIWKVSNQPQFINYIINQIKHNRMLVQQIIQHKQP